ncbi:transcriptional regulator with XRE-family HTH domain [Rhodoblastus sphagnicola]|nr:helix-turn-helix transcriptional regulator [Rhodoblastus sphagnicola]MBB4201086.1 transcriptional regulator with XRE-family HTH domain [Rhodoblastus sphagnicola]
MPKTCVIDCVIGSRLRTQRLLADLETTTLANQIGVTEQRLEEFEAGVARIDAETMRLICHVLNLQVSYFFAPWTKAEKQSADIYLVAAE